MSTTARTGGAGQARVVWAAWALLSAGALLLVALYGRNVPFWDDWKLAPVLLGGKPLSLAWLWAQGNEHRLPMAKLLMWALSRLSGGDLRWTMVLSVLLLSAAAALLLVGLRRLTGRWRWTDLVLPVVLLHWGHADNMLWQVELHFVLAVVLFLATLITLLVIAAEEEGGAGGARAGGARAGEAARVGEAAPAGTPARRANLALFATAGLLPLQSGMGLCLSTVLLVWMVGAARRVRDPSRRRALRLCAAWMGLLLVVLLANLPASPAANIGFQGVASSLRTTLQCLGMSVGPLAQQLWPWSGLLVALLGLASAVLLVRRVLRAPEQRLRASALLAGLLAMAGLALAIGVSRAGLGWKAGIQPRYVTLMSPVLCCCYLAWRLHGGEVGRRLLPAALCVALCLALPANTTLGLREAQQRVAILDAFAADVRAGVPTEELVRAHGPSLCPDPAVLAARLELLQDGRRWFYR